MRQDNSSIVFDNDASVRIWRGLDASIIIVVSQGPEGSATHITLTPAEARAVMNLLTRKLSEDRP